MLHEVADTALVVELDGRGVCNAFALTIHGVGRVLAQIAEHDVQTSVQESHHLESLGERRRTELDFIEDASVRPEPHRGAGAWSSVVIGLRGSDVVAAVR